MSRQGRSLTPPKSTDRQIPIRLQSILTPKLQSVPRKRFKPLIPDRLPKLVHRRKSSEIESEHRMAEIKTLQQFVKQSLINSSLASNPKSMIKVKKPRGNSQTTFGIPQHHSTIQKLAEKHKLKLNQQDWLSQAKEAGNICTPLTLPFEKQEDKRVEHVMMNSEGELREGERMFVQLPREFPIDHKQKGIGGKLRVYKSGRIEMQIGNSQMEVLPGVPISFYQEIACQKNEKLCFLGPVSSQLVVAPNLVNEQQNDGLSHSIVDFNFQML